MEKKLLETKTLQEVRDIIKSDTSFITNAILYSQIEFPLYKLVREISPNLEMIKFYRDRTIKTDLYNAFTETLKVSKEDLFTLLLTEKTANVALEASIPYSLEKVKQCFDYAKFYEQKTLDTALGIAIIDITNSIFKSKSLDTINFLLEKGAVFSKDINLLYIIQQGRSYPICYDAVSLILQQEMATEIPQNVKNFSLIESIRDNKLSIAEKLLELGADPGSVYLETTCYNANDDPSCIRLLLRYGANPNHTCLSTAINHNKKNIVKALIEYKVDIHSVRSSALRNASEKGFFDIVELLLKAGAKVSAENQESIRYASKNGHLQVVKLLLEYGANPRVKNNQALEWAKNRRHNDVANLLEEWIQKQELEKNKN